MTAATQVRIDAKVKKEASELFATLGIDMSTAMNMFLRQCILRGGIPFEIVVPNYKKEVISAMEEGEKLAKDESAERYDSFEAFKKAVEE